MKKKSYQNNGEINLEDIIKILKISWSNKIKIIFITLTCVFIAIGYNYTNSDVNRNLFKIKVNQQTNNFSEILLLQELIKNLSFDPGRYNNVDNTVPHNNNKNVEYLNKFISELMDFNELRTVLKNYENHKNNSSEFSIVHEDKNNHYILSFTWDDYDESRAIIEQTIKLTLNSLKNRSIQDLNFLLQLRTEQLRYTDLERVEFLLEQVKIAKKLKENSKDLSHNNDTLIFQKDLSHNNDTLIFQKENFENDYLRGYLALEIEIQNIKNRNYKNLDLLKKRINSLMQYDYNFIDYEIFLEDQFSLKNEFKIIFMSILFGLTLGIICSVILGRQSFNRS
jgi:hypothetical protein